MTHQELTGGVSWVSRAIWRKRLGEPPVSMPVKHSETVVCVCVRVRV